MVNLKKSSLLDPVALLILYPFVNAITLSTESIQFWSTRGMIKIIYLAVASYWIVLKGWTANKRLVASSSFKWYLSYLFIAVITAVWTFSGSYILIFLRATECFILLQIIVGALNLSISYSDLQKRMRSIIIAFLIANTLAFVVLRNEYTLFSFGGANQFFSTTFFFYAILFNKGILRLIIVFLAVISGSTVGHIGIVIGSLFYLWSRSKILVMAMLSGLLILGSSVASDFVMATLFWDKKEVSFDNTSGRDNIFNSAVDAWKDRPLFGYGFVEGENLALLEYARFDFNGSHNSFLSALLGTGIVGTIFFTIFIATSLWAIRRIKSKIFRITLFASFIVVFFHNIGNPGVGGKVFASWMPSMLLLVFIQILIAKQNEKSFMA